MVVRFMRRTWRSTNSGHAEGYLHGAMDRCSGYSGRQPRLPASPLPYLYANVLPAGRLRLWGVVVGDLSATSWSPRSSGRSSKSSRRGIVSTYTSSRLEVLRLTKGDAKEWARRYIGRRPFLFYNFYRLKPSRRNLLVDRRTRIV